MSRPVSAIGAKLAGLHGAEGLAVDERRRIDLARGQRGRQVGRLDLDLFEIAAFERGVEAIFVDERHAHLRVAGRTQAVGAERFPLELLRLLASANRS